MPETIILDKSTIICQSTYVMYEIDLDYKLLLNCKLKNQKTYMIDHMSSSNQNFKLIRSKYILLCIFLKCKKNGISIE